MSDDGNRPAGNRGHRRIWISTFLVTGLVLLLALGAVLLPGRNERSGRRVLLVLDPLSVQRATAAFDPLAAALTRVVGQPLDLVIATDRAEFRQHVSAADLVICPDLVALTLPAERFVPVVCGRRPAPYNLRPRSVLVYRKTAVRLEAPWWSAPERTVLGDSLSLAGSGPVWRRAADSNPGESRRTAAGCAHGPDPYDHTPALHAMRLGCFDYAVVRQWAAQRFSNDGLLSPVEWGIEELTEPLPDVVVLAARTWSGADRIALTEALVKVGRYEDGELPERRAIRDGLARVGLAGFNILLEPELQAIGRRYLPGWPPTAE